jgi:uncharacterized 2Fe-2S/4Fe-4S cluster protein (DUF4445 family)
VPRVTFRTLGKVVEIADGDTVFDAGARVGASIDTACVGKGTCGLCRVKVLDGEAHLTPYTDDELNHQCDLYHLGGVWVWSSPQVRGGDVVVDLAPRRSRRG